MIFSYLKLALRLLARNPLSTFINVIGLSIGFAVFFILWQYSQAELKSDQFHTDFERIVRFGLTYHFKESNSETKDGILATNDPALTRDVAQTFGEVESFTRIFAQKNLSREYIPSHGQDIFLAHTNETGERKSFVENNLVYADPNLFTFFNFPLIEGNPALVLNEPYSVVISENIAAKYFGSDEAVGKVLQLNNETALKVTGVFKNLPRNTHLAFDIVVSTLTVSNSIDKIKITNGGPYCYLKLTPATTVKSFEAKVKTFVDERYNELFKKNCNTCTSEAYLQPIREIPFNSGYWFDTAIPKSKYLLVVLSSISIIILVMAWINYVNLALTANLKRIKELAARKTVGANHFDFLKQYVVESFLINVMAIVGAAILVQMMLSPAESLLQFYIPDLRNISMSTVIISSLAFLLGIFFTGVYPVFITLRNNPRVLFGTYKVLKKGNSFSKALTTIQLSFAVILIVWVFSVHLQLNLVLNKDLGIQKEHIVNIDLPVTRQENFESLLSSFSEEVLRIPGVAGETVSNSLPGFQSKFFVIEKNGAFFSPQTNGGVDDHFIPLYGIKLLAGRNFQPGNPSDQNAVIVSHTLTRQMGYKDPVEAIGQRMDINTVEFGSEMAPIEIIGVIEDYKVDPLFASVNNRDGLALLYKNYLIPKGIAPRKVSLKIAPDQFEASIQKVEQLYGSLFSGDVFNWNFLDQQIGRFYQNEKITRNQITFFTTLAIGIACLGLLGIIRNKATERIKEIGIRKVLGAEFGHLSFILLATTLRQVALAVLIGIPVATYLTQQYLEKFSERIAIQWWQYVLPVLILLIIMLASVASTLINVNRVNPVDSLRQE